MRIQDFNPVLKEDNEMSDVVTAHGLMNRALTDQEARQEYFEFLQHLRNKHGKEYSTRVHQQSAAMAKATKQKGVNENAEPSTFKIGDTVLVKNYQGAGKIHSFHQGKARVIMPRNVRAEVEISDLHHTKSKYEFDPVNEFAPPISGRDDDDNYDLQLYIDVAKKLNMKKYKPATANKLIAKKMSELVSVVDDEKVDYARHIARKEQGLLSTLGENAWTGENPAWGNSDPFTGENPAWGGGSSGAVAGSLPIEEDFNAQDVVSVDVPLLIRLLEYAREDAKTDMDLHDVTERLIALSQEGNTLTMQDYDTICNTKETD